MEEVRSAVSTLCVMAVLCVGLEAVIPEGTAKNYAKFVFALAAMSVMLSPVFQLVEWMTGNGP